MKAYKYRAHINKKTENNLNRCFLECYFVYNMSLREKKLYPWLNKFDLIKKLPALKSRHPELKFVNAQVLQQTVERVSNAWKNYTDRKKLGIKKAGKPRYRSIYRYKSFTLKQTGYKLIGDKIRIKNVGTFKIKLHRPIQGEIKTVTVKKENDKYYIIFTCNNIPKKEVPYSTEVVGIDLGLTNIATDSNGKKFDNPKYFKKSHDMLKKRQQKLAKCVKKSKNFYKHAKLVAKAHAKIKNQREDYQHKLSRYYIDNYNVICVEDLKPNNMLNSRYNLNKSIYDASWTSFLTMLDYKAEEAGRIIVRVNPRNTSKTCSLCNKIVEKTLYDRTHICPYCGLVLNRDINSAINILWLGTSLDQRSRNVEQKPTCFSCG